MARRYVASKHVSYQALDSEAVLLDLASGRYFGLNETGVEVWKQLELQPHTREHLVEAVCSAFAVEPDICRRDLDALLAELLAARLIEEL
jgi:hypothetical protein